MYCAINIKIKHTVAEIRRTDLAKVFVSHFGEDFVEVGLVGKVDESIVKDS